MGKQNDWHFSFCQVHGLESILVFIDGVFWYTPVNRSMRKDDALFIFLKVPITFAKFYQNNNYIELRLHPSSMHKIGNSVISNANNNISLEICNSPYLITPNSRSQDPKEYLQTPLLHLKSLKSIAFLHRSSLFGPALAAGRSFK